MATELAVQSERAYQKQPHIFQNAKKVRKTARAGKNGRRWYKDVGLGFKTPKTAIDGTYIDKKCPFVGEVSIRGRILTGTVISTKMHRTLVIRREYLHFVPKYARYERRHKNLAAHVSPAFRVEEGDQVTVGQCRPLSKTVSRSSSFATPALLLTRPPGPLQRPPRPPPHRQGRQAVLQVLNCSLRQQPWSFSGVFSGMGQQRRRQEDQNSPLSAALKKQNAFVASSFFPSITITTPNDARPDAQKRKNMAFYDTRRKGCFFVCANQGSDMSCVVKSQCHTLKHDFLFSLLLALFLCL
jgi:small subunit ribosomal protein S11e